MAEFQYDDDRHEYTLGGKRLEHITEVLRPLLPLDYYTAEARDRGDMVHRAIKQMCDNGVENTPAEGLAGYFKAWADFVRDYQYEPILYEVPLHHPTLLYAGTPDQDGLIRGIETTFEVKTGGPSPTFALQTAAQVELIKANKLGKPKQRATLYLKSNGRYLINFHKDRSDWSVFMSLLNIHRWKVQHNIK